MRLRETPHETLPVPSKYRTLRCRGVTVTQQNPLRRLQQLGQSVWLDYLERGYVTGGGLAKAITDDGVTGLTSNPAIFHRAITEHREYDSAISAMACHGLAAHEILEALIIEDIRNAADLFADAYDRTGGRDGLVSLEVSPHFARDTEGTYWEAKRLWTLVNRKNLMIKVPGTVEALPAIRSLTAEAINVNVTLLFSVERYTAVSDAFIAGLEQRAASRKPLADIASVASFFLSRIDTLVDQRLESCGDAEAKMLRGQCAIACAQLAYARFRSLMQDTRWHSLMGRGARPQRLLWASTGNKNPSYGDVKYVDALIGPDTITTLPLETLAAYRDHGHPTLGLPLGSSGDHASKAEELIRRLAAAGIDFDSIAQQLEDEGIRKFIDPWEATLAALRMRLR